MKIDLPLRVRFLAPYEQVMQNAARIGAENGRNEFDAPATLDAAIIEILLYGMDARRDGVLFLPSDAHDTGCHHLHMSLYMSQTEDDEEIIGELCAPFEWPETRNDRLTGAMNSPASPLDMGFEIDDTGYYDPARSSHQIVADMHSVRNATYRGPDTTALDRTLFATREMLQQA